MPGELSLIGYDDSHLSDNPRIDLTAVHQDAAAMAHHAVRLAVDMLEARAATPTTSAGSQDDDRDVVLEPRLVVRGGTAGPREPAEC